MAIPLPITLGSKKARTASGDLVVSNFTKITRCCLILARLASLRTLLPRSSLQWFNHGSAKQAPSPLFCSVLACSGAPTKPTRFVCSAAPYFFLEAGDGGAAEGRGRRPPAWLPPGYRVKTRGGGREKNPENIRGRVSNKISGLLEGLSLATCGPMHSQRPDCIGALHFAFASRPYRPCTCLGADLLCAVRRLRPGFPAHEHDHPANADVSAVRTKSEVLVHAMRAETTEALVVCSEHVGSALLQSRRMPCSRSDYRFLG